MAITLAEVKKSGSTTAVASRTVTLTSAYNNTHLLLAVCMAGGNTNTMSAGAGWTKVHEFTNTASNAMTMAVFARRGDGAVNSITVTPLGSSRGAVWLFAWAGYYSLTPLLLTGTNRASNTSVTINPASTPSGKGVMLACAFVDFTLTSWGAWSAAGYTAPLTVGTGDLANIAYKEYVGSAATYSASVSWSPARSNSDYVIIMPLGTQIKTSAALGSSVRTLALGSKAVTGVVGTEPA